MSLGCLDLLILLTLASRRSHDIVNMVPAAIG